MKRRAPIATNRRETRLVPFPVEDLDSRPLLCTPNSTEGLKASSHVMPFNIRGELVIRAWCGEIHRHTTITKKQLITRSTLQAQWYAPENHHGSSLQCCVCHSLASGDAFSSVSLFNTVMVFSVGFSGVLALAFWFDTWPPPCKTHCGKCPCKLSCVFQMSMGDAVYAVLSGGQHVMRSCRM